MLSPTFFYAFVYNKRLEKRIVDFSIEKRLKFENQTLNKSFRSKQICANMTQDSQI